LQVLAHVKTRRKTPRELFGEYGAADGYASLVQWKAGRRKNLDLRRSMDMEAHSSRLQRLVDEKIKPLMESQFLEERLRFGHDAQVRKEVTRKRAESIAFRSMLHRTRRNHEDADLVSDKFPGSSFKIPRTVRIVLMILFLFLLFAVRFYFALVVGSFTKSRETCWTVFANSRVLPPGRDY